MNRFFKSAVIAGILSFGISAVSYSASINDWALPEYEEAASLGLITYNVMSENLKEDITREEFCEISVKLYEKLSKKKANVSNVSPFSDSDSLDVRKAYHYGLISGNGDGTFEPERNVTRQEMAKILENVLNASEVKYEITDGKREAENLFSDNGLISDWAKPSVSIVTRYGIMNGSGGMFNPYSNATREQAIISIYRTYKEFHSGREDKYVIKCLNPKEDQIISEGYNVKLTAVGKAVRYVIFIKDRDGNLVHNSSISNPASFKINSRILEPDNWYTFFGGAILADGSEVYTVPVNFLFESEKEEILEEPVIEEPPAVVPEETEPKEPVNEPDIEEPKDPVVDLPENEQREEIPDDGIEEITYDDEVWSDAAKALIEEGEKYLGTPYVYGGTTPEGFDCSGFVKYVFEQFGIKLKRVSRDQYAYCGISVSRKDLQPGDLVFFGTGGVVGHVGIYTGKGMMIHSPTTGKNLCYTTIESDYYRSRYIGAKRILD